MRVVLEVASGPSSGKRVELAPGQVVLVGRASWAELPIPQDPEISGRHFRLECTDNRCLLVDQKNSSGTYLNGVKVSEAVLRDGDRITAGQTSFTVRTEGGDAVPPRETEMVSSGAITMAEPDTLPAAPIKAPAMPQAGAAAGLKLFHLGDPLSEPADNRPYAPNMPAAASEYTLRFTEQPGFSPAHARGWLYAVVDGGQQRILAWRAKLAGYDPILLVPGPQAPVLATKAPYFFAIPRAAKFFDEWQHVTLGQQLGLLIDSSAAPEALFDHLRQLLGSEDPQAFLRFQDARALRKHLLGSAPQDLGKIFGPVERWIVEAEDGTGWEAFVRKGDQLARLKLGKVELIKQG